ncbi:hypothetical protein ACLQ3B_33005 [Micromonospora sp. DT53]|uniref:hypothetical protein n=1 Tax=Micromonospora sp. DT53 TaxID=3393444 RepID=UPI003CF3A6CA
MSTKARQVAGLVVAGMASACAAVVTNVLTDRWSWTLLVALGALVLVGLGGQLLALASPSDDTGVGVRGGGAGSVVIGGDNSGSISVRVSQPRRELPPYSDTV